MRKHVAICLFCFAMYFSNHIKAQTLINWEWQNVTNISYQDLEFKNNFIYSVGNFTADSVTLGSNTYVNAGDTDIIICKMDTLGNIIWSKHVGSSNNESLNSIYVDNNDNVLVIGKMQGTLNVSPFTLNSIGGVDILMIKCDSVGNVLLAKNVGTLGYDEGYDITCDYNNDIYAVGRKDTNNLIFAATNNAYNNAILKWSSSGTEVSMQYMRGGLVGLPASASTYLIKYSDYDSTLIIGGGFYSGSALTTYYSICHSSNTSLYATIFASPSWGWVNGYYLCKTNLNGFAKKIYGCAPSNVSGIYDLATNPVNGDFYFSDRVHWPLSVSDYNHWIKGDTSFANFTNLPINLSSNPMPPAGTYGAPLKINYFNGSLYGLLYQTHLTSNISCSDYYSATLNLSTNVSELKNLDYGQTYTSGVGFNGTFCMGSNNTIGKSCQANCAVQAFSISPAPDVNICPNSNIQIGGNPCFYANGGSQSYTYSWQPTIGLNNPNISNPIVSNLTSSITYTVTITDQGTNIGYDTINVTLNSTNSGNSSVTACNFYNWGGTNYTTTGIYTHTFTNANGCDSIHTLNLIVNLGNYIFLNVSACASYNWNGITYTISGAYSNTFTNVNGCDSIINLYLTIHTIDTSITQVSNSLTANQTSATYQWMSCNPDVILVGETGQNFIATANGDYAVIINKNACTDTSNCFTVSNVGLEDLSAMNGHLIVYPNPASNTIHVNWNFVSNKSTTLKLYNVMGQLIYTSVIPPHQFAATIDVSHFAQGVYYLKCGEISRKVIVE
ncbi:MAG: T9SS type A sorting domain-containing protein [Bacteroidetes bacterium]|nr:T9SS type A sorting domain-containing protein [Bacteroidota bacterium]